MKKRRFFAPFRRILYTALFALVMLFVNFATPAFADCASNEFMTPDGCKENKFSVITTEMEAGEKFGFYINAAGKFWVDCGAEADTQILYLDYTTTDSHSVIQCEYTNSSGSHEIKLSGTATDYSSSYPQSAIRFSSHNYPSSPNPFLDATVDKIKNITGSLGAVFPTITSGNPNVRNPSFEATFDSAENLEGPLPTGLFYGITETRAYMFYATFQSCTKLTGGIPDFSNITGEGKSRMFYSTFNNCSKLDGTIPYNTFSGITSGADWMFSNTFRLCPNLTGSAPTFASIVNTTSADNYMFYNTFASSGITSLPSDMFSGITSGAPYMFYDTFFKSSNLTEISDGTTSTTYIPSDFLSNITSNTDATGMTANMFYRSGLQTSCNNTQYNENTRYNVGAAWCGECPDGYNSDSGATSVTQCYTSCPVAIDGSTYYSGNAYYVGDGEPDDISSCQYTKPCSSINPMPTNATSVTYGYADVGAGTSNARALCTPNADNTECVLRWPNACGFTALTCSPGYEQDNIAPLKDYMSRNIHSQSVAYIDLDGTTQGDTTGLNTGDFRRTYQDGTNIYGSSVCDASDNWCSCKITKYSLGNETEEHPGNSYWTNTEFTEDCTDYCSGLCVGAAYNPYNAGVYDSSFINSYIGGLGKQLACVPATYTVTLDANGGMHVADGVTTVDVVYESSMPTISADKLPGRPGYVFAGYYDSQSSGNNVTKYYNADGTSATTYTLTAGTTLYAQWTTCQKNNYCPGDNTRNSCATDTGNEYEYTNNNTATSINQCVKYVDYSCDDLNTYSGLNPDKVVSIDGYYTSSLNSHSYGKCTIAYDGSSTCGWDSLGKCVVENVTCSTGYTQQETAPLASKVLDSNVDYVYQNIDGTSSWTQQAILDFPQEYAEVTQFLNTNQITLQNGDGVMWWEDGDYLLTTSACVNLSNAADTWNGTNSSDFRLLRFEHDAFTAGQSNGDRCVCRINGYSTNGTYNTLGDTSYWYQPFWSSSDDNWNCSTGCAERCLVTIEGGGINYFLSKQLHSPVFYQTSCMPDENTVTLDKNADNATWPDGAIQSVDGIYDSPMPTISADKLPGRPGYVFDGYYDKKLNYYDNPNGNNATKYYNADGTSATTYALTTGITLYAYWKICDEGNYCPGDNTELSCSTATNGEYTTTNANGASNINQCIKIVDYSCSDFDTYTGINQDKLLSITKYYNDGLNYMDGENICAIAYDGSSTCSWDALGNCVVQEVSCSTGYHSENIAPFADKINVTGKAAYYDFDEDNIKYKGASDSTFFETNYPSLNLQHGEFMVAWDDQNSLLGTASCVYLSNAADTGYGRNGEGAILRFPYNAFEPLQTDGNECVCRLQGYTKDGVYTGMNAESYWFSPVGGAYEDHDDCISSCAYRCAEVIKGAGIHYSFAKKMHSPVFYQTSCMPETSQIKYYYDMGGQEEVDVTGISGAPTSYVYGVGATINAVLPTRADGSVFAGWCVNDINHCSPTQTISAEDLGDKEFFAVWLRSCPSYTKENAHNITYSNATMINNQPYAKCWYEENMEKCYFEDISKCFITSFECDTGYDYINMDDLGTIIGDTSGSSSAYFNGNGEFYESSASYGQSYYGITDTNTFAVDYGTNKGILTGKGVCSTLPTDATVAPIAYSGNDETFINSLTTNSSAKFCYCQIDGYYEQSPSSGGVKQPIVDSLWVGISDLISYNGCSRACTGTCASRLESSSLNSIYSDYFVQNTFAQPLSYCAKHKYTVTLDKNADNATWPDDATQSVEVANSSPMPTISADKLPGRPGYAFAGYYDAQQNGNKYYNADGTSANNWNKTQDFTLYARWTPNTYTVTIMCDDTQVYSQTVQTGTTATVDMSGCTRRGHIIDDTLDCTNEIFPSSEYDDQGEPLNIFWLSEIIDGRPNNENITCQAIWNLCEAGKYCPDTDNVKHDCPSGYPNSLIGSYSISQCYRECNTSDVDNATSVGGQYYQDGTNKCYAKTCDTGYRTENPRIEFPDITNGSNDTKYRSSSSSTNFTNDTTIDVDDFKLIWNSGDVQGTLKGHAVSTVLEGGFNGGYADGYVAHLESIDTNLDIISRYNTAGYCLCQLDSWTPADSNTATALSNNILTFSGYTINRNTCAKQCTTTFNASGTYSQPRRQAWFDFADETLTRCISQNVATLDANGGTHVADGVTSIYVTNGEAMPDIPFAKLPGRPGYVFAGYYDSQSSGNNVTKYYNADGTSATTYGLTTGITLYAHWNKCAVDHYDDAGGYYCPGDNTRHACATDTNGEFEYANSSIASSINQCVKFTPQDCSELDTYTGINKDKVATVTDYYLGINGGFMCSTAYDGSTTCGSDVAGDCVVKNVSCVTGYHQENTAPLASLASTGQNNSAYVASNFDGTFSRSGRVNGLDPIEFFNTYYPNLNLQNGQFINAWDANNSISGVASCVFLSNAANLEEHILRFEHNTFEPLQTNGDQCVCRVDGYTKDGVYNEVEDSYWFTAFDIYNGDNDICITNCAKLCGQIIHGSGIDYFYSRQMSHNLFYQTSCMPKNITLNYFDTDGTPYTSIDTQHSQCTFNTQSGTDWNLFTPTKTGYTFAGWSVSNP